MTVPHGALPGWLALLGHPVSHSLSPTFQNAALQDAGIPLVYATRDVPPADLAKVLERARSERGAGNVTIPHKRAVFELCDVTTPDAQRVRAVNTFWVNDGVLHGDNTDIAGFDHAVRNVFDRISIDPKAFPRPTRVTILGAGGAAYAVAAAVTAWVNTELTVWNRSAPHAEELARWFDGTRVELDLLRSVQTADLVINATPIGLHDNDLPVPVEVLRVDAVAYDLVYRQGGTPWVRAASQHRIRAADGIAMLVEQGALAFERWFGQPPNREAMWRALNLPMPGGLRKFPRYLPHIIIP